MADANSAVTDDAVAQLVGIAQCEPSQARFLLEATNGNMQAALQMFYDHSSGLGASAAAPAPPITGRRPQQQQLPPRPRAPISAGTAAPPPQAHRQGILGSVVRLPFMLLRTGIGLVSTTLALTLGVAVFFGDRILPAPVMRGVRGAAAAITGAGTPTDADGQARAFVAKFKEQYGSTCPAFEESSVQRATRSARVQHMFLLVYLHAPDHQNTDTFCREVLCAPDLLDFCRNRLVVWGGDIRHQDAYTLSNRLGATTYPFVALLAPSSDSSDKVSLLAAAQGSVLLGRGKLLDVVSRVVEDREAVLVAQRAEAMEREAARQLLAEQDAEYERALVADREREARRAEEAARQAEEERRRAEEEAAKRAAEEAEAKRAADAVAAVDSRRAAKKQALLQEPAPGTAGAAVVRVRLPDGSHTQRSFPPAATLGALFDWVDSLDSTTYLNYNLVSSYPRKVFTHPEAAVAAASSGSSTPGSSSSLADVGLVPHAALFVQPCLDDEENGSQA